MEVVIELSLQAYDLFVDRCGPASREYTLLKNAVIVRRPKTDYFERIVEIRCRLEEAELLRDSAKQIYPDIVPAIERAITVSAGPS